MVVWAISDLHLPARQKPMDIFGEHWQNHFEHISRDWLERVAENDIVLLPGDLSWAMHLEEALEDLSRIGALTGRKILVRGNHDYWWSSIGRVRRAIDKGMYALQNDSIMLDGLLFAGTRGWQIPLTLAEDTDDVRIYRRERQRLEMSLMHARRCSKDAPLTVVMHYPPRMENVEGFADLFKCYDVSTVVYGHLHGAGLMGAVRGEIDGINYHQVSCDGLGFRLKRIFEN